jgi:predicted metalloendopeptidase
VKSAVLLVVLTLGAASSQPPASGLDPALIGPTVHPQDDLFRAANGRWLARTVPPDRVTYGTFTELSDKTERGLRLIVETVAAGRARERGSARQVADLYARLMDQRRTEERGLQPIAYLLCANDAIDTPGDRQYRDPSRRVSFWEGR